MMDEFLRLATANTTRNLETCGVLAGSLVSTVQSTYFLASYDFIYLISCPDLLWPRCYQVDGIFYLDNILFVWSCRRRAFFMLVP